VPRAGLSQDVVVDAAVRIADSDGLETLTLSAVAAELGVQTPSLYKHVAGLPALRREIGLRAKHDLANVLGRATVGKARRDALLALATAYRTWANAHPSSATAAQRAPLPGDEDDLEASAEVTRIVFAVLDGYGLSEDAVIDATRALRALLVGWTTLEAGESFGMARPVAESFDWWVDALDRSLSAG
jgi:AcrR family transcriptional regulator